MTNKDTLYFKPKNLHNYQYFLGIVDLILLNGTFLSNVPQSMDHKTSKHNNISSQVMVVPVTIISAVTLLLGSEGIDFVLGAEQKNHKPFPLFLQKAA